MVFTKDYHIIAKTFSSLGLYFEKIPPISLKSADEGEVVILPNQNNDRVRALVKLLSFENTYLLVGRDVDQEILNHIKVTQGSQAQYESLLLEIGKTRTKLCIAFFALAVTLCISAILIAVNLLRKIAKPINQLILATAEIKEGNYNVRIVEKPGRDETTTLIRAFNQMTHQIEQQTQHLLLINLTLDERRRFIETVLKEISSGVMVIDTNGTISICNQLIFQLLAKQESEVIGKSYNEVIIEVSDLLEKAKNNPGNVVSGDIELMHDKGRIHLFVRISAQLSNEKKFIEAYVITMDDMTTLVAAQKSAAWGEVARKIAHEIKNPLTPINLAAERLHYKFSKQIFEDKESF